MMVFILGGNFNKLKMQCLMLVFVPVVMVIVKKKFIPVLMRNSIFPSKRRMIFMVDYRLQYKITKGNYFRVFSLDAFSIMRSRLGQTL